MKGAGKVWNSTPAFLEYDLIHPCWSPYKTPPLPVQKPGTGGYQFVHHFRAMNQIVGDTHL